MSRVSFENYAIRAKQNLSYTIIAGRCSLQQADEKNIIHDIISKLELSPDDDLLEIGCGPGNLLIPLSFLVRKATGIDHPCVLERLATRFDDEAIEGIAGNFLDLNIDRQFSKVLVYSVLHYLSDEDEVIYFVEKAVHLLRPGGILLLGDIPNADRKARFLATPAGKDFEKQWNSAGRDRTASVEGLAEDNQMVKFYDEFVLRILLHFRKRGLFSYVFPQPYNLPFGFSREDIIIRKAR
jgi:2-polyprenyl-3-methyl-5-hydroxy-6-metoxy-1,4-benzoquinol methylase